MFGSQPSPAGLTSQPIAPGPALQSPDIPQLKKRGGMFSGMTIDINRGIAGYLAGLGNPAGIQMLRSMDEQRQQQMEESRQTRERQQSLQDQMSLYDYEAQHPKPANNDTANDYSFWQQHLSPEQFQQYVANKVDPPQYMNVPGVGLVQIPRGGPSAAPTAPVGKLTPLGAGGPASGPGGFHY